VDPLIRDAISSFGTVLALLAATLVSMAIAGIFKELSGKVRSAWRVLCKKAKRKSL